MGLEVFQLSPTEHVYKHPQHVSFHLQHLNYCRPDLCIYVYRRNYVGRVFCLYSCPAAGPPFVHSSSPSFYLFSSPSLYICVLVLVTLFCIYEIAD